MLYTKKNDSPTPIQSSSDYIQKKKVKAIMIDFHKIQLKNMTGYSKHILRLHCPPNPPC